MFLDAKFPADHPLLIVPQRLVRGSSLGSRHSIFNTYVTTSGYDHGASAPLSLASPIDCRRSFLDPLAPREQLHRYPLPRSRRLHWHLVPQREIGESRSPSAPSGVPPTLPSLRRFSAVCAPSLADSRSQVPVLRNSMAARPPSPYTVRSRLPQCGARSAEDLRNRIFPRPPGKRSQKTGFPRGFAGVSPQSRGNMRGHGILGSPWSGSGRDAAVGPQMPELLPQYVACVLLDIIIAVTARQGHECRTVRI